MEQAWLPITIRMNKEDVVYVVNKKISVIKWNRVVLFTIHCMQPRIVLLNELRQSHGGKCCCLSHVGLRFYIESKSPMCL